MIVRTTLDAIMNESAFDDSGRRRDQRCADALVQLAKAASNGAIHGGRSNAKALVTVPFETIVERGAARGVTHAGPTVDADAVRQMACDAGIHRVVVGPGSSILDFGRENRLVSENLFLALVARDRHGRWPGCAIRATWCDAHHVTEWGHEGRTNESTCALLCHHHHSLTHQPGWTVDGNGHEFTIRHPDGSVEVSRPPRSPGDHQAAVSQGSGCRGHITGPEPPRRVDPLRVDTDRPRAGEVGRPDARRCWSGRWGWVSSCSLSCRCRGPGRSQGRDRDRDRDACRSWGSGQSWSVELRLTSSSVAMAMGNGQWQRQWTSADRIGHTLHVPGASGFEWEMRKSGDVVVRHHGTVATTLRGRRARDFVEEVDAGDERDAQELMARLTGNYKRGNERAARQHPRNSGRSG